MMWVCFIGIYLIASSSVLRFRTNDTLTDVQTKSINFFMSIALRIYIVLGDPQVHIPLKLNMGISQYTNPALFTCTQTFANV